MRPWVRNLIWCGLAAAALLFVALQVLANLTRPGREEAMNRLRTRLADSQRSNVNPPDGPVVPAKVRDAGSTPKCSVEEVREKAKRLMEAFRDKKDWIGANDIRPFKLLSEIAWGLRDVRDLTKEEIDLLRNYLEPMADILEQADSLPWDQWSNAMVDAQTDLAGLIEMWDLASGCDRFLMAQAVLDARAGNADGLFKDIALFLRVRETSSMYRDSFGFLADMVVDALEQGAVSRNAEEELLMQLARSRGREVFRRQQEQRLALMVKTLDELPQSLSEMEDDPFRRTLALGYCTVGLPLFNYDVQNFAADAERVLDASALPHLEAEAALGDIRAECDARFLGNFGRNLGVGYMSDPARFAARAEQEAWMDLTRLGVTLERYQTDHGAYPATLDALRDRFPEGLPVDPFSGGPYRYTSDGQSFQLYSIGRNLEDSGGSGHIVWPGRSEHPAASGPVVQ